MRERFQLPTAIWLVQYQLLGKSRRLFGITAAYALSLIVGTYAFRQVPSLRSVSLVEFSGGALYVMAALQPLIIIIGGCNAIFRAIQRDHQTKMIESHRLTPMSNVSVVLGYVSGPPLLALLLFAVNLAVGAILTGLAQLPISGWFLGNLLVLGGAISLGIVTVFAGMQGGKQRGATGSLIGLISVAFPLLMFLPGGGLFLGSYNVVLGYQLSASTNKVPPEAVAIILAANFIFFVFWLFATASKYRRPDLPTLNSWRGLILLALWVVAGAAGILAFQQITKTSMPAFYDPSFLRVQWIATMIASLLVAGIAVRDSVACQTLLRRGAASRDRADCVSDLLVAILAVVVIGVGLFVVGFSAWVQLFQQILLQNAAPPVDRLMGELWLGSVATCLLAVLMIRAMFVISYSLFRTPKMAGFILVLLLVIPPMIDLIHAQIDLDQDAMPAYSWLLGASPPGTIVALWADLKVALWPGLLIQVVLAVVLTAVAWYIRRREGVNQPAGTTMPDRVAPEPYSGK